MLALLAKGVSAIYILQCTILAVSKQIAHLTGLLPPFSHRICSLTVQPTKSVSIAAAQSVFPNLFVRSLLADPHSRHVEDQNKRGMKGAEGC